MAHILSEIKFQNLKLLVNATLGFSTFKPLVWLNNAGNSNIIYAIELILRGCSLTTTNFHDQSVDDVVT